MNITADDRGFSPFGGRRSHETVFCQPIGSGVRCACQKVSPVMAQARTVSISGEKWVLAATILASSMAFIDSTALNVALPALQRDLNTSGTELLWVVNAYALFLSALLLVGGSLGDHYGRKRIFGSGIIVFTGGSLACGLAPDSGMLIAARAVQGIGAALMVPGSLAIISALIADERRGPAIGTWSAATTITTAAGPLLGGWLAGQGLWRAVFFINLPLGVLALAILWRFVPENRDEHAGGLDIPGGLLATIALAGLTYGFIEAPSLGLADPRIVGALLIGIVGLIAFAVVELRSPHPMVPPRLFRSRTFSGANLLTLFLYAALNGALFFLPLNLVQIQGYPETVAGFAFMPFIIMLTLLSRWAGGLVARTGPRLPLTVGPAVAGIGFLLFALPGMTGGADDYWTTFFPGVLVLGVGMGITVAPLTTTVLGAVPRQNSGTASGINNAVARTAGVLAIAILGAVALVTFGGGLEQRAVSMGLDEPALAALRVEAARLAEAQPPAGLTPPMADQMRGEIAWAFVDTFRFISMVAAVMAWLSALLAALLVAPRRQETASAPVRPDQPD